MFGNPNIARMISVIRTSEYCRKFQFGSYYKSLPNLLVLARGSQKSGKTATQEGTHDALPSNGRPRAPAVLARRRGRGGFWATVSGPTGSPATALRWRPSAVIPMPRASPPDRSRSTNYSCRRPWIGCRADGRSIAFNSAIKPRRNSKVAHVTLSIVRNTVAILKAHPTSATIVPAPRHA